MKGGGAVDEWVEETKRFQDVDRFPVCPGCRFLGGVEDTEAAVLVKLRTAFCNNRLFDGARVPFAAAGFNKFDALAKMSALLGAQVRSVAEPAVLKALNRFCASVAAGGEGRMCEVDTPFFAVTAFMFPTAEGQQAWLAWARWATDVC
jgi:hypothetical protein